MKSHSFEEKVEMRAAVHIQINELSRASSPEEIELGRNYLSAFIAEMSRNDVISQIEKDELSELLKIAESQAGEGLAASN